MGEDKSGGEVAAARIEHERRLAVEHSEQMGGQVGGKGEEALALVNFNVAVAPQHEAPLNDIVVVVHRLGRMGQGENGGDSRELAERSPRVSRLGRMFAP
jgi:hypothetical protein